MKNYEVINKCIHSYIHVNKDMNKNLKYTYEYK
jgi:hypothetical protein